MRSIGAIVLSCTFLLVGFVAISMQADAVGSISGDAAEANDAATAVFEGFGSTLALVLPWAGFAAAVIVALGIAVVASRGGR